jgi:hypothetical protein
VEGPCEHGNKPSGSIKCWEILGAVQLAVSQEGLSSMELVSFYKLLIFFLSTRISHLNSCTDLRYSFHCFLVLPLSSFPCSFTPACYHRPPTPVLHLNYSSSSKATFSFQQRQCCRILGSQSGGYEECRLTFNGLHGVISQKMVLFNKMFMLFHY